MIEELPKTKVCSKCKEEKALSEFHKDKSSADGMHSNCKKCKAISIKKWKTENPEKVKERLKKWRTENPEKVKENAKKWKTENPEKVKESLKKWRTENQEWVKNHHRKWMTQNQKKVKENKKKSVKNLVNFYLKKILKDQLPLFDQLGEEQQKELIEFKRVHILLTREIRNQQNAN